MEGLMDVATKQLLGDRDSNLVRALDENLTRRFRETNEVPTGRQRILMRIHLSTDEKEKLTAYFPEFEITYDQSRLYSHGYAAASRKLETELLLSRGACGKKPLIDIGGNWADHLLSRRTNIHSCCPIIDVRDSARHTERLDRVYKVMDSIKSNEEVRFPENTNVARFLEKQKEGTQDMYCNRLSQQCHHKAEYGIAVHSIYDIEFDDLPLIMNAHGLNTLHGCFIFFPAIVSKAKDRVPLESKELKVVVVKNAKKDTIEFTFKTDSSNAYCHSYSNYLKYITRTFVAHKDTLFYYELMENRGGIQFFKLIRCLHVPLKPIMRQAKYVWMGNEEVYAVKVYGYGDITTRLNQKDPLGELVTDFVFIEKVTYERTLEYALGVNKEATPLFEAIYSYMRSINNRVIVSGINVTTPERTDVNTMFKVAVSIYAHTVFMKYVGNQTRARLDTQIKRYFELLKSGFFALAGSFVKEALCNTGDQLHDNAIGGLRAAMLKRMNSVKNQSEYQMEDFYIRFEDYIFFSLKHRRQLLDQDRRSQLKSLLNYYSHHMDLTFPRMIRKWLLRKIEKVDTSESVPLTKLRQRLQACEDPNTSIGDLIEFEVTVPIGEDLPYSQPAECFGEDVASTMVTTPTLLPLAHPDVNVTFAELGQAPCRVTVLKPRPRPTPLPTVYEQASEADSQEIIPELLDLTGAPDQISRDFAQSVLTLTAPSRSTVDSTSSGLVSTTPEVSNSDNPSGETVTPPVATPPSNSLCELNLPLLKAPTKKHKLKIPKWLKNLTFSRDVKSDCAPLISRDERSVLTDVDVSSVYTDESVESAHADVRDWLEQSPAPALCAAIEPTSVTPLRESPSASEFIEYLNKELKANLKTGETSWNRVISSFTHEPNEFQLCSCYMMNETALLVKHTTNIYRPFQPKMSSIGAACGEYDVVFDGKEFLQCRYARQGTLETYQVTSNNKYLLVSKDTRLLQCAHMLRVFDHNPRTPNGSATIRLVEGVPGCGKTTEIISRSKPGDLVLTVARKTKDEIALKMTKTGKNVTVRTVDSYVLNDRKNYTRVYLDEGLMIHAGLIEIVRDYSQCSELLLFGDRNQLNFTCRVSDFHLRYHVFPSYDDYEMRNLSYRCPQDVADVFTNIYEGGFTTTNPIRKSLAVKVIQTSHDIPGYFDKYMVFTQEEKKDMIRYGFENTNTIHECQGTTYPKVALVRLTSKSYEIYSRMKYVLVGLTRHTTNLTYFTMKPNDVVYDVIQGTRRVTTSDMKEMSLYGSHLIKGKVDGEYTVADVEKRERKCEGEVSQLRTLQLENPYFMESEGFQAVSQIVPLDFVTVPRGKIEFNLKTDRVIDALQMYYDDVLPLASTEYKEHDEYQVQTSDLHLTLENLQLNLARDGEKTEKMLKDIVLYSPKLRTGQPNKRSSTFRQSALAIMKRNCDTPRNALPADQPELFKKTLAALGGLFFRPDYKQVMNRYVNEPIAMTREGIEEWLCSQEPSKLKRIDLQDSLIEVGKVLDYQMMIKSQPKNKLEPAGVMEYISPQNIVFHQASVNAVFGPMFKILYQRFITLLHPNVCVMLQKSHEDLETHMNTHLDSTLNYHKLEIDFSKFDKSQTEICFEVEMAFWELLGMNSALHDLWKIGHYNVSAKDFQAGIKARFLFQRKSGDSATAFGNTIISMASVAYAAGINNVDAAYFIGDDSLLFFKNKLSHTNMPAILSNTFNLSAKILEMKHGYFCSMFILQTVGGFKVVPDPLKRIEKLGSELTVNDVEDLRQRYVSFKELIEPLSDDSLHETLVEAMAERYGRSDGSLAAIMALRCAASDFRTFKALYQRADC